MKSEVRLALILPIWASRTSKTSPCRPSLCGGLEGGRRRYAALAARCPAWHSVRRLSIVVLPFANLGGDPEQDYFVDGITESLTTDLSRINGSFVIARNTAFTFKGKAWTCRSWVGS